MFVFFFFQAEDGIRDVAVTGVQTCALPICYYRHFKDIGDALGPFDLAALPIGSYTPRALARAVHISPEEALQAWLDLRAAKFLGIHWGTFALAREPYDEPPRRIAAEVSRLNLDAEAVWIRKPGATTAW